jgi:hypothetical protein
MNRAIPLASQAAADVSGPPRVLNAGVVGRKLSADRVYVGRPSKWGNPFKLSNATPAGRIKVIAKYRAWIATQPALMVALPELRDKDLVCWCAPLPCHADVLLELANGGAP